MTETKMNDFIKSVASKCETEKTVSLAALSQLKQVGKRFHRHHNRRKIRKCAILAPTINLLVERRGVPFDRLTDDEIEGAINALYGVWQGRYKAFDEIQEMYKVYNS